jgi:hypothetical protein
MGKRSEGYRLRFIGAGWKQPAFLLAAGQKRNCRSFRSPREFALDDRQKSWLRMSGQLVAQDEIPVDGMTNSGVYGGRSGTRTPDLLRVKQAL